MTYVVLRIAVTALIIAIVAGMATDNQPTAGAAKGCAFIGNAAIWTAVITGIMSAWRYWR